MKKSSLPLLALALLGFGSVHAGEITSASDPALQHAAVEDFDESPIHQEVNRWTYAGVTVSSVDGFQVTGNPNVTDLVPPNGQDDLAINKLTAAPLFFTFAQPTSAFGFEIGATNDNQTVSIYDLSGALLDSFVIPYEVGREPFPYSGYFGYASDANDIGSFSITNNFDDNWAFDYLSYVSSPERTPSSGVPDSGATAVLLAIGLFGLSAMRRELAC